MAKCLDFCCFNEPITYRLFVKQIHFSVRRIFSSEIIKTFPFFWKLSTARSSTWCGNFILSTADEHFGTKTIAMNFHQKLYLINSIETFLIYESGYEMKTANSSSSYISHPCFSAVYNMSRWWEKWNQSTSVTVLKLFGLASNSSLQSFQIKALMSQSFTLKHVKSIWRCFPTI